MLINVIHIDMLKVSIINKKRKNMNVVLLNTLSRSINFLF